jgi:hypothetical protein
LPGGHGLVGEVVALDAVFGGLIIIGAGEAGRFEPLGSFIIGQLNVFTTRIDEQHARPSLFLS